MGLEEELLRIAKKLEKMVARKKTVRLQSLQRSPRATEARLGQPRAWWACRPCARRERSGLGIRDPRRAAGGCHAGESLRYLGWACACAWPGLEGIVQAPTRRGWCKSVWTGPVH
ncbi:hypothetical protein NN561_013208 [Cricetulus griseus]